MEIIHKHKLITDPDKLLENEIKEKDIIQFLEPKKITIQKRKIKNKTYYSYIIGITRTALNIIMENYFGPNDAPGKDGYTAFKKISNAVYELIITDEIKPGLIALNELIGYDKHEVYQNTLPKKEIEYLQAYDKYLEYIDYLNDKYDKEFVANDFEVFIIINIAPLNDQELQKEVIIKFVTHIDEKFISNVELLNDVKPEWLELLTDYSDDYAPTTF